MQRMQHGGGDLVVDEHAHRLRALSRHGRGRVQAGVEEHPFVAARPIGAGQERAAMGRVLKTVTRMNPRYHARA